MLCAGVWRLVWGSLQGQGTTSGTYSVPGLAATQRNDPEKEQL